MMISKAIVEAIYSMEPPGRFLKKCHESGQWRELTKGEAADKAAQAMAYLVRANLKQKMKRSHSLPSSSRDMGAASSQSAHNQLPIPSHVNVHNASYVSASTASASASAASRQWGEGANADDDGGHNNPWACNEVFPNNPSLQQQLLQMQQSSTTPFPSYSSLSAPLDLNKDGLTPLTRAHLLSQAQLQQQYHQQQRQLYRQYFMMQQHALNPSQTRLPCSSLPSTQSITAPGPIPPNMDFLRQEYLIRGYYGTGAQPSRLLQHQRNVNVHAWHGAMGDNLPNQSQSMFGTAISPQQEAQLLDQVHRAATLRNLLSIVPSLAASNRQPQSQPHQVELLQRNSQYPHRNNSFIEEVEVELRNVNTAPPSTKERRGEDEQNETEDDER
mmetsp:Transcript_21305/g.32199  ORF Transcript_21305/g.32199 Transcript_21305/m.32199 type:complete len:386 (+) Transcript_21305:1114-2271(+)